MYVHTLGGRGGERERADELDSTTQYYHTNLCDMEDNMYMYSSPSLVHGWDAVASQAVIDRSWHRSNIYI